MLRVHGDPRQRKHRGQMEERKAGQGGKCPQQHIAPFIAHDTGHAHGLQLQLLQQFGIRLAHHQAQTGKQSHHVDGKSHKKRIAPAPVQKLGHAQAAVQISKQTGRQHKPDGGTQLANHGKPAAALLRGAQGQQGRQTVPRPTQRQPLADAEHHQRHDGDRARRGVTRQKRHARRAGPQQEQRQRQLGAPPPAPLNGHRNGGAERTRHKRDRKDGKSSQGAVQPRQKRKQQRRKHQHAGNTKHKEVEIFGRPANDHAHRDLAGGDILIRMGPRQRPFTLKPWRTQRRRTLANHIDIPQLNYCPSSTLHRSSSQV
ncbi:hypothetical protein D3C72_1316070 [compost metagenome]